MMTPSLRRAPTAGGRRVLLISAVESPVDFLFFNNISPGLIHLRAGIERLGTDVEPQIVLWTGAADLSRALATVRPAVVGISAFSTFMPLALRIARQVREFDPGIPIVLGGYHASAFPGGIGKYKELDYFVRGEGVRVGPRLIQALLDGRPELGAIASLSFRGESGVEMTPLEELSTDMDDNPPVRWQARDRADFSSNTTAILGDQDFRLTFAARKLFPYQSSQGCNHQCRFCERETRTVRRWHSPDRVAADLEAIRQHFDNRYVFFSDDHPHKDRQRFVSLLDALRRYGRLRYYMAVRADELDQELVDRMADAGVCIVHCFPESGAERIRTAMGKPIAMDRLLGNMERAKAKGMLVYGSFMFGWPTETRGEAETTLRLAGSSCFDLVSFMPLIYFGGADVGRHLIELGIEPDSPRYFELLADPTRACLAQYTREEYRELLGRERLLNKEKLDDGARRVRLKEMDIEVTPLRVAPEHRLGKATDRELLGSLRDALPEIAAEAGCRIRASSFEEGGDVVSVAFEHASGTVTAYVAGRSGQPHYAQTCWFNVAYRSQTLDRAGEVCLRRFVERLDAWRPSAVTPAVELLQRIPEAAPIMGDPEEARVYAEWDTDGPFRDFISHFRRVFPNDRVDGHVLDLGCGQGEVTFLFARAFPRCRIDGVDAAEVMVAQAQRKMRERQEERLRFSRVSLPDEAAPEEIYDCVISNSLLHHLPLGQVMWQAARRYARSGAPVFVMDLVRPSTREQARGLVDKYGKELHAVVRRDFFNSLLAAYTLDEMRGQLDVAGLGSFVVERVSDIQAIVHGRMVA
jgi:radical SAM superfamily enzyme YgiQ (UPF0313 family)/SAM-dependent methyltransferase